jgi:nucleotide-binding universal stress UspA family protein
MDNMNILEGKRVLVVDDEPDVLETVREILHMCLVYVAATFEKGVEILNSREVDVVILDIMGVRGYDLLDLCTGKGIPALMLTAHALSPDHLRKSVEKGAQAYVPKEKIAEISVYLSDILKARQAGIEKRGAWFARLRPFFYRKFGLDWRDERCDFLLQVERVDLILVPTDFSFWSCEAFPWAAFLARKLDARVLILHVLAKKAAERIVQEPGNPWEKVLEQEDKRMIEDFNACLVGDFGRNVEVDTAVAVGSPQDEILKMSRDCDASMIVMSTHGRTGLARTFMGSVAEYVVRNASCPVFSVKPQEITANRSH